MNHDTLNDISVYIKSEFNLIMPVLVISQYLECSFV